MKCSEIIKDIDASSTIADLDVYDVLVEDLTLAVFMISAVYLIRYAKMTS